MSGKYVAGVHRQAGFALMLALFLIVSLAAIGVYLLTVSTGQIAAGIQDEQGARAFQAARTGVDWGAYQLLQNSGGAFASSCKSGGTPSRRITLAQGLSGFYTEIRCQRLGAEAEGAVPAVTTVLIISTGCNASGGCTPAAPSPAYVERQLQLTLTVTN